MTIEATLERIAISLEAIVESQGIVAGLATAAAVPLFSDEKQEQLDLSPPAADADDLSDFDEDDLEDDLDVDDEPEPAPKTKTKKKTTKKTSKKAPTKKKVGKKVASEFSEADVREKLKELQITSGDARMPKSILKRNGASTLKQLEEGKRSNVIAEIQAELDQYE